ncbi:signal peptide peptidase SppA [Qipengyuania atrilutea]|uniref:Signal peptide peptidase SppA n=1 Tax=Qipengyuania atrilutea TaxID=2744473 RepID=A0A850H6B5_9SPHN|nr:signal peptide peptidase SppA [Actirhodobacter atriluteus]NVD45388.1 signal peptide peptidase SppA [Actirhodobacter atriluteus]
MSFAGKVWRLLVGIKDGLVLLFLLLFFWALFAVLTARPSPAQVRDGALLLNLDGVIVEEQSEIDPIAALLANQAPIREYQARDLVRAIDGAASDARIKAIVLDLDTFLGGGQVHLSEVGEALARFRAAGKPVFSFATAYADDSLQLASHASEIWMDPLGGALITGPGNTRVYLGGLLDRLNINARVYRVGTYKSAVEPYTRSSMSPEARENAQALYGALWQEWQAGVKKARPSMEIERVTNAPAEWITASRGDLAAAAIDANLVDKLGSRYDFGKRVAEVTGVGDEGAGSFAHTGIDPWLADLGRDLTGRSIGVVTIAGEIVDGDAGPGTAGGERIADLLDEALESDLAGLVVRVDSPGGSVLASEEIRRAILRHKARGRPVAVSMANVAASGGYWVATPATRIFAEPETITGSIGIFAVIPTFEDLAAQYGVATDGVTTTPLTGQPDLIGGFTQETDTILQAGIEDGYNDFLRRVAASRGMSISRVDAIAQGRVWDGGTARQIGLIDQYGGLDEALAWVAGEAALGDGEWHAQFLGTEPNTYDTLLRQLLMSEDDAAAGAHASRDVFALAAAGRGGGAAALSADLDRLMQTRGMQAYCLECPAKVATQETGGFAGWLKMLARLLD